MVFFIYPISRCLQNTYFQYEYPKADEISSEQKVYIRDHMIKVENSIAGEDFEDPVNGYRRYMDIQSLMDFIIINEISKNPDAYRLSTYFYKERDSDGGKIKFGPVWDFNLGFGNVDYCTQGNPDGLVINTFNDVCPGDNWVIHFWWNKFLQDELFYNDLKQRWKTLRSNQLTDQRVNFVIDSVATLLSQAQVRNFQQWPILGQYVWPNYFVGTTYIEEVNYLKAWVKSRFKYLDKEWEVKNSNVSDIDLGLYSVGPNPTNSLLSLNFKETIPSDLTITLYDSRGVIFSNMIKTTNNKSIELDIRGLPSGLFLIQINMQGKIYTHKIIKQ
ncbi:MAG: CotH kinase family protein [Saprospiraceae bacterium]|nr:CotH kinase family protein [Saprospiraceae bacterium]